MYEQLIKLLSDKKHNCFTFTDKIVPVDTIDKIVNDMYDLVPSKQSKVPWQLDILGPNRSLEDKTVIYNLTYNKLHDENGKIVGRPNPQSDAPYVFIFSHRYLDKAAIDRNYDLLNNDAFQWAAASEIGFASLMLKYFAIAEGLDFGFCGCIDSEYIDATRKHFNKNNFWSPKLVCGIGYGTYEVNNTVMNYRTIEEEQFLRPGTIKKPSFDTIITKYY